MKQTGYAIVDLNDGQTVKAHPVLPMVRVRLPTGDLCSFDKVGLVTGDGRFKCVERWTEDMPSPFHRKVAGDVDKFIDGRVVLIPGSEPPNLHDMVTFHKARIKEAAGQMILAAFPEWKQRNMIASGVALQDAWRRAGQWTQEQVALSELLDARWAWIGSVRAHSDALEAEIDTIASSGDQSIPTLMLWTQHDWPGAAP